MNDSRAIVTPRAILQVLLFVVLMPLLPVLISGRMGWWEGWIYGLLAILSFGISRMLAARRHPDLLAERGRLTEQQDAEGWDRRLAPWLGLGGVGMLVVIGLDARFGWSPDFSPTAKWAALIALLAGYALSSYALIENRFFSATVRIQRERDHRVVSSGPYRWIRHPGYAGALLTYLATPVFMESWWALIPAALTASLMGLRTALEDRTLQDRLQGYREYAARVRYRLVPGVW